MSHVAENWTDRHGRQHTSCVECEQAWPCRTADKKKPAGWLLGGLTDVDSAIAAVAHGFNVSVEDINGDSRHRHVLAARHCAMAVVKTATELSFPAIGRLFGRDHTTVMHAVNKVMADPELRRAVELVVDDLRPAPRLFAVPGEAVS